MRTKPKNKIFKAIILSIFLHMILAGGGVALTNAGYLDWLRFFDYDIPKKKQPIVIELEPPKPKTQPELKQVPNLPDRFFEIEDNPNANEETPKNAHTLSAKSSISAAPKDADLEQNPFDKTISTETQNDPETMEDLGLETIDNDSPVEKDNTTNPGDEIQFYQTKVFSKDLLSRPKKNTSPSPQKKLSKPKSANELNLLPKDFKGDLVGEVALSTYAWEWAPWFLGFKKEFYQFLYVPQAYREGWIEGYTDVWIKISREGKMLDFKILRSEGHPSLKEASVHAFRASAPWKALPKNFPDPSLEMNIRVIFPNLKDLYRHYQQQTQQKEQQ